MTENQNEEYDETADPFSPANLPVVHFIVQARIYDVLMALLTHLNPEVARDLLEVHATGDFMGPSPAMSGKFITDIMLAAEGELGHDMGSPFDNLNTTE